MDIKDVHLRELLELAEASGDIIKFLFTRILASPYVDAEFREKAISMMARRTDPEKLSREVGVEMIAQARVILWILGPIWIASGKTLPSVTGLKWRERLDNEPRTDWDAYFTQFSRHNEMWQQAVNDGLPAIKEGSSRITVVRITRIFLEQLPKPMLVG